MGGCGLGGCVAGTCVSGALMPVLAWWLGGLAVSVLTGFGGWLLGFFSSTSIKALLWLAALAWVVWLIGPQLGIF